MAILLNEWVVSALLGKVLKSENILNGAIGFLKIRIWGIPFLYLFQMGNALLVGSNNSKYLKYGFVVQAVVNILLDYALIFGHFGFKAYGFNGAAYASIAAEGIGMIIVFAIIYFKNFAERFSFGMHWALDFITIRIVFNQSLPLMMQYFLSIGAWLLFYIFIEHKGERELAISNTMRNIFSVFGIFIWAFANTANMMVSNIIGQQRQAEVLKLVNKIARMSFVTIALLCLVLNIFPRTILGIYDATPDFITLALPVVRVVSISLVVSSVAVVWLNSITGTGNTRVNLLVELITIFLYIVYIYIVVEHLRLSLVIAWASEMLYWTSTFILSFFYMRSKKWMNKKIWD